MFIEPFGVEQWMNAQETRAAWNLAETCVHSLTLAELLALTGRNARALDDLLPLRLTYGAIPGSDRLRRAIAALYATVPPERVIVTHGTAGANDLLHRALVSPGDRVVSLVPTYQQHTAIPRSLGAEVVELPLDPARGFLPDPAALAAAARGARLIAFTNPNNPTGALMDRARLEAIVAIARAEGAFLLADEVYRGTEQAGEAITPSVADLYERGISTAGMSKAFSLAGLRLGWVAGPAEVIAAVERHRDYTTISVGMIDDALAALALESAPRILARARALTRTNLAILSEWAAATPGVRLHRPAAGTTALLAYGLSLPSRAFCLALLEEEGVLFVPGEVFGREGEVRIGYACETAVLREGLARTARFLARRRP